MMVVTLASVIPESDRRASRTTEVISGVARHRWRTALPMNPDAPTMITFMVVAVDMTVVGYESYVYCWIKYSSSPLVLVPIAGGLCNQSVGGAVNGQPASDWWMSVVGRACTATNVGAASVTSMIEEVADLGHPDHILSNSVPDLDRPCSQSVYVYNIAMRKSRCKMISRRQM